MDRLKKKKYYSVKNEFEWKYNKKDKNSFSKFIKLCRIQYTELFELKKLFTIRELAKEMGISYEQLRKMINKERTFSSRDQIIAICLILCMSLEDINFALNLYGMPRIDENIKREYYIMQLISSQNSEETIIKRNFNEINKELVDNGYDELNINTKKSRCLKKRKNCKYEIIDIYSEDLDDEVDEYRNIGYMGLIYDYRIENYNYRTVIVLKEKETSDWYVLQYLWRNKDYQWLVYKNKNISIFDSRFQYKNDDDEKFEYYKRHLFERAILDKRRLLDIINDTKNYVRRTSAGVIKGKFHVFHEFFNNLNPEKQEYFFIDYVDREYHYYIYKESVFMKYQLKNDYVKYYSERQFNCTEIKDINIEKYSQFDEKRRFANIFHQEERKVKDIVSSLYKKVLFVREHDEENIDTVFYYYNINKEFDCVEEKNTLDIGPDIIIYANKKSYIFKIDKKDIEITKDDVYRAYELGYEDIDQICKTKLEYNNFDDILKPRECS